MQQSAATGIQYCDPLGPALFPLAVDKVARAVEDTPEKVLLDVQHIPNQLQAMGLEITSIKSGLTFLDHAPRKEEHREICFKMMLPDVKIGPSSQRTVLGH